MSSTNDEKSIEALGLEELNADAARAVNGGFIPLGPFPSPFPFPLPDDPYSVSRYAL